MDLPLTNSNICNVRREYNDRLAFRGQWTHLFLTAKQAFTHVAYKPTISLCTIAILFMIFSVRQVVIATVVRHCDERTTFRSRLGCQGVVVDVVFAKLTAENSCEDGPRVIVSARDESHILPTGYPACATSKVSSRSDKLASGDRSIICSLSSHYT
jgi:hypothetical protein